MAIVWSMKGKTVILFCAVLCIRVVHHNKKTRTIIVFMTEVGPVVPVG